MTQKPHRTFVDRLSGYADEAAAFARRRRQLRKPFARVYLKGGRLTELPAHEDKGREMFGSAARLIELGGPSRKPRMTRPANRPG